MAGAQGIRAGRAYVEVGTYDKYIAGLRKAQRRLKAFGAAVTSIGMGMMKIGAMAVAPLLMAAKAFARMGDRIAKMAKRTGMSVEALSGLEFAASQSGTSIEALEKSIKRMQMTIMDAGRGLSTAVDGLAALGLEYKDLAGLAPEDQFKLIAEHLSKVADASEKAAIASMVFGRAGTALLPMIAGGAKGIEELTAKAEKYGLVISAEAATGAEEFTDAMDIATRVVKMAAFEVGQALVPALMDAVRWIVDTTRAATKWIKANQDAVVWTLKWSATLVGLGVALVATGVAINVLATALTVLKIGFAAAFIGCKALVWVFGLLMAHPIVGFLGALAAAIAIVASGFREAADEAKDAEEAWKEILKMEEEYEAARLKKKKDAAADRAKRKEQAAARETTTEVQRLEKDLAGWRRMLALKRKEELELIEDVYERQVRRIKDRFAEERREAKGQELTLAGIDLAESAALQTAYELRERQIAKTAAEEKRRAAEKAAEEDRRRKEAIAAADLTRGRDIEELELRATKKGHDLEMALLEMRRKRAIEAARKAGENVDQVRKEFEIRKKILDQSKVVQKIAAGVTGTFSARALWGMGGGKAADRTAVATEATAKSVKKIARTQAAGGPKFT